MLVHRCAGWFEPVRRTVGLMLMGLVLGCGSANSTKPVTPAAVDEPLLTATALPEKNEDGSSSSGESGSSGKTVGMGAITTGDWPCFLGPHGTGVSDETGLLDEWPPEGPAIVWEKKIGTGYSSPSIRGDRLVVHHRQRHEDIIECLNPADGQELWTHRYDTDYSDPYGYNNGPRCSPLLTETHCYTFGAQGRLVCLNLKSGKVVWERDTAKDWRVPDHFFGAGCTPILEGGLLIVLVGGQPDSGVVAFDANTGKTVWESVGQKTWDGATTDERGSRAQYSWTGDEMIVSYSSPIAVTIHEQRHLLCLMRQGLVSLDPTDGRVRFKYWFRSRTHESVNAARPVVVNDLVVLSAAYETGAACLKIHADGDGFDEVWRLKRGLSTHWSTPIHQDGCVYGFSGRHENEGTLQCIDLATGELVWETNGYDGNVDDLARDGESGQIKDTKTGKIVPWPFYGRGSSTLAEGKHFILGERGTLALARLEKKGPREFSRASYPKLKYPMWASPVLSRGRLYLRSEDWLVCLNVAKPGN